MAKINNLFVTETPPKKVYLSYDKNKLDMNTIRRIYYNNELIWENSNPFIFVSDLSQIDLSKLEQDTIVFVGFTNKHFDGTYDIMEDENDIPKQPGQMVVKNTTEGDK